MKVLVTGANSRLGGAIADVLAPAHRLRLWGVGATDGAKVEWIDGDVRDPDVAWRAVRGVDAIVHTGEPPEALPEDLLTREQVLLDLATRGTHVLFKAGIEAGVKRFVYGSTLGVFSAYPDDVYISELWKPRPTPEMFSLTRYLGELAAREFARDHLVAVTALRLGTLVLEEEVAGQSPDLMWLDLRDAARAFALALNREASSEVYFRRRWAVHHICAQIPNGKYLVGSNGWNALEGFQSEHNFEAQWGGAV
ncbi:MAG: NAD(P)-dependent oxidoreductase [bacterium]|nr:NAD(P)-dependent oxidoreductase [bacterium]